MTGDGSIGDYQGGGGDASFGGGPADVGGDSAAADLAASLGLDTSQKGSFTAPSDINVEQGQTLQGALAQALFDRLSQIDYTTPAGMAQGRFGLESMANLGLGRTEGLNPNNPTQSVDEMLAANNVATAMGYIAPAIASLAPGFGTLSTIGRVGAGLMSGTMTPGQAFATGLAGLIGAKINIPSGIVEGLFEGNLGKAAGSGAQAGLGALTTGLTGNPLAGALTSAALGPAVGRAVSDAVGGGSSKSGGLAGAVDRGLGTSNWGGLFGGSSAPSTSTAPTGNASGDAYGGINPETYAVTAAIEQAAQEAMQPSWKRETVAGRYGPTVQYEYGV